MGTGDESHPLGHWDFEQRQKQTFADLQFY